MPQLALIPPEQDSSTPTSARRGYVAIPREFFDDPLWQEPRKLSKAEAWLDLIQLAACMDGPYKTLTGDIPLRRGEVMASTRTLATRWGWSRGAVQRFLTLRKQQGKLVTRVWDTNRTTKWDTYGVRYLIAEYELWCGPGRARGTPSGTLNDEGVGQEESVKQLSSKEKTLVTRGVTSVCGEEPEADTAASQGERVPKPKRSRSLTKHSYTAEFEEAWAMYPEQARGTKMTAFRQWQARLAEGHTPEIMTSGLTRYQAFLTSSGRFAKLASTFFGRDLHFLEPWALTPQLVPEVRPKAKSAEDEQGESRKLQLLVTTRRNKADGDVWWGEMQALAERNGWNAKQLWAHAGHSLTA